jgi:hypothetical protein
MVSRGLTFDRSFVSFRPVADRLQLAQLETVIERQWLRDAIHDVIHPDVDPSGRVRHVSLSAVARYFPARREVAYVAGLSDLELYRVFAHELTHAWRDQVEGLGPLLAGSQTTEARNVLLCLTEGEAELVARELVRARYGAVGEPLIVGGGPLSLLSDPTGTVDAQWQLVGLSWLRSAGWGQAQRSVLPERGLTTARMMSPACVVPIARDELRLASHAESLNGDVDARVDVVGQLGIYRLLVSFGLSASESFAASIGWKGDLCVLVDKEGLGPSIRWRTSWSRSADAKQFANAIERVIPRSSVVVIDHVVDFSLGVGSGRSTVFSDELFVIRRRGVAPIESLLAWTAELQLRLYALRYPYLRGDRWLFPALGISLRVPPGFVARDPWFVSSIIRHVGSDGDGVVEVYGPDGGALDRLPTDVREEIDSLLPESFAEGESAVSPLAVVERASVGGGAHEVFLVDYCDAGTYVLYVSLLGGDSRGLALELSRSAASLEPEPDSR